LHFLKTGLVANTCSTIAFISVLTLIKLRQRAIDSTCQSLGAAVVRHIFNRNLIQSLANVYTYIDLTEDDIRTPNFGI
jgi:hypothetical protein